MLTNEFRPKKAFKIFNFFEIDFLNLIKRILDLKIIFRTLVDECQFKPILQEFNERISACNLFSEISMEEFPKTRISEAQQMNFDLTIIFKILQNEFRTKINFEELKNRISTKIQFQPKMILKLSIVEYLSRIGFKKNFIRILTSKTIDRI